MNVNKELIFNFMKDNHLTKKTFAEKCGISVYTLNRIIAGSGRVKSNKVLKVVRVMEIRFFDLWGF